MNNFKSIIDAIEGEPIIAYSRFWAILCNANNRAGLLLRQLLFWGAEQNKQTIWHHKKTDFFLKTVNEVDITICMPKAEQLGAIKLLKKLKFIETDILGIPASRYFKINYKELEKAFEDYKVLRKKHKNIADLLAEIRSTSYRKMRQLDGGISANINHYKDSNKEEEIEENINPITSDDTSLNINNTNNLINLPKKKRQTLYNQLTKEDKQKVDKFAIAILDKYSLYANLGIKRTALKYVKNLVCLLNSKGWAYDDVKIQATDNIDNAIKGVELITNLYLNDCEKEKHEQGDNYTKDYKYIATNFFTTSKKGKLYWLNYYMILKEVQKTKNEIESKKRIIVNQNIENEKHIIIYVSDINDEKQIITEYASLKNIKDYEEARQRYLEALVFGLVSVELKSILID